MNICHQCGSEVAENDAFCPFCGISLQPVAVSVEDDEFASTIMMPQAEPSEVHGDESEVLKEDPIIDAVTVDDEQLGPAKSDDVSPNFDNIPTPPALEQLELEDLHRDTDEQIVSFENVDQSDRISEAHSITDRNSSGDDQDVKPASEQPSTEAAADLSNATENTGDLRGDSSVSESSSKEHFNVPNISKPLEELNIPDPASEPSMFDSVRIMDDRYTPTEPRAARSAPEIEGNPSAAEEQSKAHTSSAMGTVDTDGRRSAKLKPLEEGVILNGRYEIVRKIGGGGMGAVYLASDNNLGGVVRAVKEMVQAHIEEEQQDKAIDDFKRESMILSHLDHSSIPTIYDYFFDEQECRFYLVMKYISGGDLSARLRAAPEGKIDEKTVTEWGIQIADVLDYLHSQPTTIVYRDLKPSNVMIDGNSGRIMLIDFGIARSINQKEEKGVTAVGTMGYAPPELFSGNVEPRSDIYSLGSTMFHLLTGADPQSNPLLIFDFQKNPRPRQINSQLSDQIERFIMRSVEYNASARFESAAEVRAILTEHLANLNKGAVTYGVKEIPESVSLSNQPVFCGFCGQRIVATDLFCAFCGAKQPLAQQGVHSEIYGRGGVTARLLVEGTSELQSPIFPLEKGEILIGRRDPMSNIFPEVDLSKYDPQTKISRRHARIWREGNTFLVEDLGSSNGTVLMPIVHESFRLSPRQPHALTNGDKIRVGDTTLHFVVN